MKKINFNSGPSLLPDEVLHLASNAIINIENEGVSIAAISHRSKIFENILDELISLTRELLFIPNTHEIIILQGGARLQFAQIPMNFLEKNKTAGFIDTGYWAHKAMEYATYYGNVKIIASSEDKHYNCIPSINFNTDDLTYLQMTSNNTVYGTQSKIFPKCDVPLVVDMSSDIFSIQRNFEEIDLAFACAQKNIGPSGFSMVIISKNFLKKINQNVSPIFNYQNLLNKKSNYATPPVINIYMALLNLQWLKKQGSVQEIQKINQQKAAILYNEIERNNLFDCRVNENDRSNMNICFFAKNEIINDVFIEYCEQQHIIGIKGHAVVGGFRASLYNAQTIENVTYLINTMKEFEKVNTI